MEVSEVPDLERIARQTDDVVRAARARLVGAVRAAHNSGMTQTEIARRTGAPSRRSPAFCASAGRRRWPGACAIIATM